MLATVERRASEAGGNVRFAAAGAGRVDIRIDETIEVQGGDLPYGVDLRMAAVAATRIGVEAMLDLRELQSGLPELLSGEDLVDTCGGRVSLQRLEAEASGASVIATGQLEVQRFDCERTGPGSWQRGELLDAEQVGVRAEMSAAVVDDCVVFRLLDLRRDPPGAFAQLETGSGRIEAARGLVMEAVGLVLEDNAICPEVPPELAILDPVLDRGMPQEIGEGGVGIAVDGSIDVSTMTIVDVLRLLQERGAVPPPP